jgi:5-methylcytosine-specific restriction protein A
MSQGRRTQPLPRNWTRIRQRILRRDGGVCYVCGRPGADTVDHIVPASNGGTDDDDNLAAIHEVPCHQRKTAIEANAAKPKRKRPPERHPGLL